jgi:hypothetical protein
MKENVASINSIIKEKAAAQACGVSNISSMA